MRYVRQNQSYCEAIQRHFCESLFYWIGNSRQQTTDFYNQSGDPGIVAFKK